MLNNLLIFYSIVTKLEAIICEYIFIIHTKNEYFSLTIALEIRFFHSKGAWLNYKTIKIPFYSKKMGINSFLLQT